MGGLSGLCEVGPVWRVAQVQARVVVVQPLIQVGRQVGSIPQREAHVGVAQPVARDDV